MYFPQPFVSWSLLPLLSPQGLLGSGDTYEQQPRIRINPQTGWNVLLFCLGTSFLVLTHSEASRASMRHTSVYRAFSLFAVSCTFHKRTGDHGCKGVVLHPSTLFPFSVNPGFVCCLKAEELQSVMELFCTANHNLFLRKTKRGKTPANYFSFLLFPIFIGQATQMLELLQNYKGEACSKDNQPLFLAPENVALFILQHFQTSCLLPYLS